MILKVLPIVAISLASSSLFNKGNSTYVAETKIFAFYGSSSKDYSNDENNERGFLTGHCFVQIKNISTTRITIGKIGLSPNNAITISDWPYSTTYPHNGAWFNRESFDTSGWSTMENYSLTTYVTQSKLNTIWSFIGLHNSWGLITYTCANFSIELWNSLIDDTSLTLSIPVLSTLPSDVKTAIGNITGYSVNSSYVTRAFCGYVDSVGNFILN